MSEAPWQQEWEAQTGGVAPLVRELHEMFEESEAAYRTTRGAIVSTREGGVTTVERELALLVRNVTLGNPEGALTHLRVGQVLWRACLEDDQEVQP